MDRERIYFTWPDGRFSYECSTCGACCKGLGIGLDATGGQVAQLVELYPDLTAFLRKRGSTWTAFNPRGRCWFLARDGLCRIEAENGRSYKPASCRLFPFNRIFRLGEYTVVDFNSVICPLEVVSASDAGRGISHESVLADMEATRDLAVIGTRLPGNQPEQVDRRFVSRERDIARACFAAADECARHDAADKACENLACVEPVWRAQVKQGQLETARDDISRAVQFLTGQPFHCPDPRTLQTALWLTPSMRFNEFYGPRSYDNRTELASALPHMWLAWLAFLARGAHLGGRPLDVREATTIWSEQMPLAYVAARWNRAPTLLPGEYRFPGDDDPDQVVRTFARACIDNRSGRRPLSQLLIPVLERFEDPDRVALARLLEPLWPHVRFRKRR